MAARQFARRFLSLLHSNTLRPSPNSILQEPLQKFVSPPNPYSILNDLGKRTIATITQQTENSIKDDEEQKHSNPSPNPSLNINTNSNFKISPRHDLAMMFTCKVCEVRSMKTMSRESYEKGVVVARCGGCNNLHLIADHLGWFGQPGTVEDFLAARGEEWKEGSADTLNLTLEDLAGRDSRKTDG